MIPKIRKFALLQINKFTNSKDFVFPLLVLNFALFFKLHFFIPQILGYQPMYDFDTYYHLVKDLQGGTNPYTVSYMQTLGPPLLFIYYYPFSLLSLNWARSITSVINIFAGIVVCFLLAKQVKATNKKTRLTAFLGLTFVLFSSFPARFSIESGQPNLLIGLLVTLMLVSQKHKELLLSLITAIKTFYLVTLLAFVKRQKVVSLVKIVYWLILLILISMLVISPNIYAFYFENKFLQIFDQKTPIGMDYYNQSALSTFNRLGFGVAATFGNQIFLTAGSILILLTSNIEIGLIMALLLSPVTWQHYFVVLFPILVLNFYKSTNQAKRMTAMIIISFFWWVEFPSLHTTKPTIVNGLIGSHYFFSALVLVLFILLTNPHRSKTR